MKIRRIFLFVFALTLNSCANYISQMHKEFDRADGYTPQKIERDKFSMYRRQQAMKRRQNPAKTINSSNNPYVVPAVKRNYVSSSQTPKRYKAKDLADNQGDGSLWSGVEGRNKFLFTENDEKGHGDIILIKVAGKLKNEITAELKRAFPSPVKKDKGAEEKGEEGASKAPASTAANPDEQKVDDTTDKIYDKVSSVVVEEINEDHLLLRGRKNVLYKNRKRVIEVQALVARRDIMDDDTVNSNRVIENQVVVIR